MKFLRSLREVGVLELILLEARAMASRSQSPMSWSLSSESPMVELESEG